VSVILGDDGLSESEVDDPELRGLGDDAVSDDARGTRSILFAVRVSIYICTA